MIRKFLGIAASAIAVLAVVGVAWATSGTESSGDAGANVTATSLAGSSTSSISDGGSTSTSVDSSSTTTSVGSTTSTRADATTSTSLGSTTSTSIPGSTSTTFDDNSTTSTTIDDDDDVAVIADGFHTYSVGTAGTVLIEVKGGDLHLIEVTAELGWSFEVESDTADEIEVEFENGTNDAEIEIKLDGGRLEIKIDA